MNYHRLTFAYTYSFRFSYFSLPFLLFNIWTSFSFLLSYFFCRHNILSGWMILFSTQTLCQKNLLLSIISSSRRKILFKFKQFLSWTAWKKKQNRKQIFSDIFVDREFLIQVMLFWLTNSFNFHSFLDWFKSDLSYLKDLFTEWISLFFFSFLFFSFLFSSFLFFSFLFFSFLFSFPLSLWFFLSQHTYLNMIYDPLSIFHLFLSSYSRSFHVSQQCRWSPRNSYFSLVQIR